jgi:hypothetical protein
MSEDRNYSGNDPLSKTKALRADLLAEHVPHRLLETCGASATDAKISPEVAT